MRPLKARICPEARPCSASPSQTSIWHLYIEANGIYRRNR
jgi:hypothetical protein